MARCGIETLMQLGFLGNANSKQMGLLKTHLECLLCSQEIVLRKQSVITDESPTMVCFQQVDGCNNSKFGLL